MLVDSHCHLDMPEFEGELDAMVSRARDAGVGWMLTICTRVSEFGRVLALTERHDNIYCSVGIHPHEAASEPEVSAGHLVRLAQNPKVVGIGETGLDYHYEHSPREDQQRSFRAHIAAARETGLPLIVHTRAADEDTEAILGQEQGRGAFPGLIHCFTAGQPLAKRAVELGFYVSFSGILTFKKSDHIRATARALPLERILVETDAPYLAPEPKRGKRNEPAFTALTAARLAEIRGLDVDAIARATTDNFFRLFTKAQADGGASCG